LAATIKPNATSDDTINSIDNLIDSICDEFESSLVRDGQADISSYISRVDGKFASVLFSELMLVDLEYSGGRGQAISKEEYLRRFPDYCEVIETTAYKHPWPPSNSVVERVSSAAEITRIGRYVLNERVGAGAAGDVWKAYDPLLQRTVAVKIPNALRLSDADLQRFLREGRAAAQLHHPNIVTVHETAREGATAYIVVDFIDGPNLRSRLSMQRMTSGDAAELCATLADALHYAHEQGVVHRDLKPANIILDGAGQPHITDFGLAKWAGDANEMTITGQTLGTPAYMSPEQARGESATVDRRADVYALGVILYEMLTGQCPFAGSQAAVLNSVIHDAPVRPRVHDKRIERDLETICLKAIEKSPDRRYATADDFAADLRRFLDGMPVHARRVSSAEYGARWMRRRPAVVAAVSLGVAAAFFFVASKRLTDTNRQLLGLQTVLLTSSPAGAEAVIVALSDFDDRAEPVPEEIVRGRTPLTVDLKPGNYLVVVALSDGRFHEVIRRVPRDAYSPPGRYNHLYWKVEPDGSIKLPGINIPALDVTGDMALVPHEYPSASSDTEPLGIEKVQPFYIDAKEFTYGDLKNRILGGEWPKSPNWPTNNPPAESDWLPRNFDLAVHNAERVGKRLPTREEYAAAAAAIADRGDSSIQAGLGPSIAAVELRPAVPEWTDSGLPNRIPTDQGEITDELTSRKQIRLACGDAPPGSLFHRIEYPDGMTTFSAPRGEDSEIGFRGVRSAKPRFIDP
jgi:serine/threonine-protein kinase